MTYRGFVALFFQNTAIGPPVAPLLISCYSWLWVILFVIYLICLFRVHVLRVRSSFQFSDPIQSSIQFMIRHTQDVFCIDVE